MFIKYCFKKYPKAMLESVPSLIKAKSTEEIKEALFAVVRFIPDIDSFVSEFWDKNIGRISQWYLDIKRGSDLIISASPEFLVSEAARRLGVSYIATPMNKLSGKIHGLNCRGKEKVRRFNENYPCTKIEAFYSDSLSDEPLAKLADKAFLVRKSNINKWPL